MQHISADLAALQHLLPPAPRKRAQRARRTTAGLVDVDVARPTLAFNEAQEEIARPTIYRSCTAVFRPTGRRRTGCLRRCLSFEQHFSSQNEKYSCALETRSINASPPAGTYVVVSCRTHLMSRSRRVAMFAEPRLLDLTKTQRRRIELHFTVQTNQISVF